MDKRSIAILGSTGSIGTQTLEVVSKHKEKFEVEVITAQHNAELLIEQGRLFQPNCAVIGNDKLYDRVFDALDPLGIKVYSGEKAIASVVEMESIDVVVSALVGCAGLLPTINAVKSGKTIALANKETLVVAGSLITTLAREHGVDILPIDSEHSAIFQCLVGEFHNPIERLILTASGGPFRGKDRSFCAEVKKEQALKHPNWNMGAKITVDSATMVNKGLEVIEAKWLFAVDFDQIEVIVHPQSIIHSLVQFEDASVKAQLGLPDMRVPIQFALSYPERLHSDFPRFNFSDYPNLTFEEPDTATFRNLTLAIEAGRKGGNLPCILNAANEIAVKGFLEDRVGFLEISDVIESCMAKVSYIRSPLLEDFIATDKETRIKALELIR
ncbi:MAG: 1-deoxy-D-xylulose-5-phosphate reductoisomerase [Ekhidna sp.]|nr:1-deoxy-D-xylulose-5-phosphate reductoisomerase [Ekhidna sp.]